MTTIEELRKKFGVHYINYKKDVPAQLELTKVYEECKSAFSKDQKEQF